MTLTDHGTHATSLGQCPHRPGTEKWLQWQRDFIRRQVRDAERYSAAKREADERIAAAGFRHVWDACVDNEDTP